jgi:hypothetical protein
MKKIIFSLIIMVVMLTACQTDDSGESVHIKVDMPETVSLNEPFHLRANLVNNTHEDVKYQMHEGCSQPDIFEYQFLKDDSVEVTFEQEYLKNLIGCGRNITERKLYARGIINTDYIFKPKEKGKYTVIISLKGNSEVTGTIHFEVE